MKKTRFDPRQIIDSSLKRQQAKDAKNSITVSEYLKLLSEDPKISQTSKEWFIEMIESYGWEEIPEDERPLSFDGRRITRRSKTLNIINLIGMESAFDRLYRTFLSGSKSMKVIVGPTGSGKTTLLTGLLKLYERFNPRTRYALEGCPIFDEPLKILPRGESDDENSERRITEKQLGVFVGDTDICFVCRIRLLKEFTDENGVSRWWDFPVVPFRLSERGGVGSGRYSPSDAKTQSMAQLIGRENIGVTANPNRGVSDKDAFDLRAGEIGRSNRGCLWFQEGFQAGSDDRIFKITIELIQDGKLVLLGTPFPSVDIDDFIFVDCNFVGLLSFWKNKGQEAIHSRTILIEVPHILDTRQEVSKYRQLISAGVMKDYDFRNLQKPHTGSLSLDLTATFSVASRLYGCPEFSSLIWKALAYSQGRRIVRNPSVADGSVVNVDKLKILGRKGRPIEEREGMFGLDGRDTLFALAIGVASSDRCLTPLSVMRHLEYEISTRMGKSPNEVKKFLALLTGQNDELKEVSDGYKNLSIMGLYELLISRDIESVLLDAFRPLVRDLFKKYIFEATIYMNNQRGYPDDNLPKREPDIAFLKRIESAKYGMGSLEEVALKWRAEIVNHREVCLKKGEMFDFDTDITLKQAVESVFIEDHRDNVWGLMIENPEDSEKDRRAKKARKNKFLKELKARDYCDCCLEEAVDHYSSMAVRPSYEHIFFDFDPSASDI